MDSIKKRNLVWALVFAAFIIILSVVLLFDVASSSGDSFVVFIPIWFAGIVPAIITAWHNRETTEQEKAKRGLDDADIYVMMDRLVDDLDVDERQYLRRRIIEEHGDGLVDSY